MQQRMDQDGAVVRSIRLGHSAGVLGGALSVVGIGEVQQVLVFLDHVFDHVFDHI